MVRQLLKVGGRFLGRAALPIAAALEGAFLLKNLNKYTAAEPEFQEMEILEKENQKWIEAMSCVGYKPYKSGSTVSVDDEGAINALYLKRTTSFGKSEGPKPEEAIELIKKSISTLVRLENPMRMEQYNTQQPILTQRLLVAKDRIEKPYHPGIDYSPIQEELTDIVCGMQEIQSVYSKRIYNCEKKLQKKLPSNIWWAVKSSATFGLIKKK